MGRGIRTIIANLPQADVEKINSEEDAYRKAFKGTDREVLACAMKRQKDYLDELVARGLIANIERVTVLRYMRRVEATV